MRSPRARKRGAGVSQGMEIEGVCAFGYHGREIQYISVWYIGQEFCISVASG